MNMNRRKLFLSSVVAATAGFIGFRYYMSIERKLTGLISDAFGERIAKASDTRLFVEELAAFIKSQGDPEFPDSSVILYILSATNVVRALETEDKLVFLGLADATIEPGKNPLSAGWL